MTLVDMNCIMITGMSHSNAPIVQESEIIKNIVKREDITIPPLPS